MGRKEGGFPGRGTGEKPAHLVGTKSKRGLGK